MSTTAEISKELDPVTSWRLASLVAAGHAYPEALALGERSDIDLHVAVGLLERGCPNETALRILL